MVKYISKFRIILVLALTILLALVLISGCDLGGGRQPSASPVNFGIITPAKDNMSVLVRGPVQILSAFANADNISRVELWVKSESDEQLLRSDRPGEDVVRQQWIPQQAGTFTLLVRTFNTQNQQLEELARPIRVIDDTAVAQAGQPATDLGTEFQPTTPTPSPEPTGVSAGPAQPAAITLVATLTPTAEPTPVRSYPPPPPAPGIPAGPTQDQLPKLSPPVCDAAEYLGPYTGETSNRVVIVEADDIPAKVVGGTTVFRAWRLQNTGTCTWGPGYELAFYGGRSMGSGGVAFESTFPPGEVRRNTAIQSDRLVEPEGKPNQIAVLEVELLAPVIPGIHQSYWRMRNPQGVYFGPIMGVTMEVVRECQPERGGPTLYGAPTINKFEILGAGDVYRPVDPTTVTVEVGETVVLDYDIINATNFDIVIQDPTGKIETRSTTSTSERIRYVINRLGQHVITLYADNGACTVEARVFVEGVPSESEQFELDLILASSAPVSVSDANVSRSADVEAGTVSAQWQHFDKEVDEIAFHADLFRRERVTPFFDECVEVPLFGSKMEVLCGWGAWEKIESTEYPISGGAAVGSATVWDLKQGSPLPDEIQEATTGGITGEQHAEFIFCRLSDSDDVQYGVKYYVEAKKDGQAASPERSNEVDVICGESVDSPTSFNP